MITSLQRPAAGRLIIVSNRLPVTVTESAAGELNLVRSTGGLATALDAVFQQTDALWVGWTGLDRQLSWTELNSLPFPDGIVPVNLSSEQVKQYRERAFNETMYPLFLHHVPTNPCSPEDWRGVTRVMRRFAATIKHSIRPTDTIWLHDTQLALLPYYLREAGITNPIGFFFHIPFPKARYLKKLPIDSLLLKSLNQTNLLGFQTMLDAQHFKDCCRLIRPDMPITTAIRDFPIGVDFAAYHQAVLSPEVQQHVHAAEQVITDRKVIFSMSRLDHIKGIVEQLHAVELFLSQRSATARQGFVYTLVVAPSRENAIENQRCKQAIEQTVERINSRFGTNGWTPLHYMYRSLGFDELTAWYLKADVLLVTPRLDGMNLVTKEYIAARQDDKGMLVLSKTIGAAVQLKQAVLVDATSIAAIAAGLDKAFSMSQVEREHRWSALRANVQHEDIFWWAQNFMSTLEQLEHDNAFQTSPKSLHLVST